MVDRDSGNRTEQGRPREIYQSQLTDAANAARFAEDHRDLALYVYERGKWMVWTGVVWEEDRGHTITMAKATAASIYGEAGNVEDEGFRKQMARWAMVSESGQRLREMIRLAQPDMTARPEEFDRNPILLNTPSGVVSLESGAFLDRCPILLMTRCTKPDYESDALCPRWLAFLHKVLDGNQELIDYLQRAVGYSLTGRTDEQVLFLLHGSGANGKSVFLNTLHHVFGTYAQQADFSTFLVRRGEGPRPDLARLAGARLVAANESGDGRRLDEGLIKQLTGGDVIVARRLYEEEFGFTPQLALWLASNHKPEIRGTDDAIWRRIHLIPFTVTISEDEQDPRLLEALKAEGAGILRWAVDGALVWHQRGLQPPKTVLMASKYYREVSDILGDFLADRCVVAANARDTANTLYLAYKQWAADAGEKVLSQRRFGQALADRDGIDRKRGTGGRFTYRGVSLNQTTDSEPSEPSGPFSGKFDKSRGLREDFMEKGSEGSLGSLEGDRGDAWEPEEGEVAG